LDVRLFWRWLLPLMARDGEIFAGGLSGRETCCSVAWHTICREEGYVCFLESSSDLAVILIVTGVVFQFVAFSAMRKASGGRGQAAGAEHGANRTNFELRHSRRATEIKASSRPSALQWKQAQDYYEMEKTPPGIRAGELAKTAKVAYFDGVKSGPTK
jgi:hypothetical protein